MVYLKERSLLNDRSGGEDRVTIDGDELAVLTREPTHHGRAYHTAMAGHPNALSGKVKNLRFHGVPARSGGM